MESLWTNPLIQRHSWSFMGSSTASVSFNLGVLLELIHQGLLSQVEAITVEGPNVVLLGPLCGYFEHLCGPQVYHDTDHLHDLMGYPLAKLTERSVTTWFETLTTMAFRRAPLDILRRHGINVTIFEEEAGWVGYRGFRILELAEAPACTWLAFVCVSLGITLPHGTDSVDEEDADGSLIGYWDFAAFAERDFEVKSQLEHQARQVKNLCWVVSIAARKTYLDETSDICGRFDPFHCLVFGMLNLGEPDQIRTDLENKAQLRYCKPLTEEEWHCSMNWGRELVASKFSDIKQVHRPLRLHSIIAPLVMPSPPPPPLPLTVCSTLRGWLRRLFQRKKTPLAPPPPPSSPILSLPTLPPVARVRSNSLPHLQTKVKTKIARVPGDLDITVGELQSLEFGLRLELFDDYVSPFKHESQAHRRRFVRP